MNRLKPITAVILAGGFGTRLKPLKNDLPKVLLNIGGKPFLHYLLDFLHNQGIIDVVLCTGYKAQEIENFCGNGDKWNLSIKYSNEDQALGTGGAIYNARKMINSDTFLALNGDSFLKVDVLRFLDFHVNRKSAISICIASVDNINRFGSLTIDSIGKITEFMEKGKSGSGFINAGIYLIEREVLLSFPGSKVFSLEYDFFPQFVHNGLYGKLFEGTFLDIGIPSSLENANKIISKIVKFGSAIIV